MDWFTQLERAPLDPSALFVLFSFTPFRKRIGSTQKNKLVGRTTSNWQAMDVPATAWS